MKRRRARIGIAHVSAGCGFPRSPWMLGPDRNEPLQANWSAVCRWPSMDKSDAARSPAPPHYMAARCRLEAIQRQTKIGREDVKRAVEFGSLIVDISHHTEVNAGNAVKVKHRGLVDFNALQGSTFHHQSTSRIP
ncbi:MAG TPA: hypothetical protein VK602_13090 [Phyllobacterium sp.]|nr:hypothetical protein [Phyllobacterium sp.]